MVAWGPHAVNKGLGPQPCRPATHFAIIISRNRLLKLGLFYLDKGLNPQPCLPAINFTAIVSRSRLQKYGQILVVMFTP